MSGRTHVRRGLHNSLGEFRHLGCPSTTNRDVTLPVSLVLWGIYHPVRLPCTPELGQGWLCVATALKFRGWSAFPMPPRERMGYGPPTLLPPQGRSELERKIPALHPGVRIGCLQGPCGSVGPCGAPKDPKEAGFWQLFLTPNSFDPKSLF